ncbi:MAG TPA: rRNA maturation RNase YbeY [Acidimicrobiales bacterium]|jgi:probable rRNA maturation factor|nr:rRNA maturation RNase YbeY [Acidimicrobiales bacterium]
MAIEIFVADEQNDHPVDTLRWIRLAEAVLLDEGVPGEAELSMLFVDEAAMTDLNKRFLGKDSPTDVLAFPIDEEPVEGGRSPDSGGTGPGDVSEPTDLPTVLGDVVICPAVAHRNAPEHAGTYEDEVALLIVHGLLHLMGMDHEDDDEAEAMEDRERALLAKFYKPPPASIPAASAAPGESPATDPVGAADPQPPPAATEVPEPEPPPAATETPEPEQPPHPAAS